jgi:hypothetical protein
VLPHVAPYVGDDEVAVLVEACPARAFAAEAYARRVCAGRDDEVVFEPSLPPVVDDVDAFV